MYTRFIEPLLMELLTEFRILYVTGPRQAGKTTVVRSIAEQLGLTYFTLDNKSILEAALNDPHGFIRSLNNTPTIIDEFQYAPSLIGAIKEASDQLKPYEKGKFILTGSTDVFRSSKMQEALPGHMARMELYPLCRGEIIGERNNIIDFIEKGVFTMSETPFISRDQFAEMIIHGGYPEVQSKSLRGKQIWFKSYLEGRLLKDFETLYNARGDYHSKVHALTHYLSGLSGNLLKYSNVSNDLGLEDKLVKTYIEILELMFIVKRLPGYLKNRAKRLAITMPKLHMVDTGLACFLLGLTNSQQLLSSPYYGSLLETFVYMDLVKQSAWANQSISLYHFRDQHKNEIDLVLEQPDGHVWGIEVKASSSVSLDDFRHFIKFADFCGSLFLGGIVFYTGQTILTFSKDNIPLYALPIGLFV